MNKQFKIVLTISGALCALVGFYCFLAQLAVSDAVFHENNFWNFPIDRKYTVMNGEDSDRTELDYGPMYFAVDKYKKRFTGIHYTYKKKMKIDPFPPRIKGINYHIDGRLWGFSGTPSTLENKNTSLYKKGMEINHPILIHKNYEKNIHKILNEYGDFIPVAEFEKRLTPRTEILFHTQQENILYKRVIEYHENGMIWHIKTYEYNMDEQPFWWPIGDELNRPFDMLGCPDIVHDIDWDRKIRWSKNDFKLRDTIPEPILSVMASGKKKEELKKFFEELPYKRFPRFGNFVWNPNRRVAENIADMYEADWNTVQQVSFVMRSRADGHQVKLEPKDESEVIRIFSSTKRVIIEPYWDQIMSNEIFSFTDKEDNSIPLYFLDDRFIVVNEFQAIPIENPEDIEIMNQLKEKYLEQWREILKELSKKE